MNFFFFSRKIIVFGRTAFTFGVFVLRFYPRRDITHVRRGAAGRIVVVVAGPISYTVIIIDGIPDISTSVLRTIPWFSL